MENKKIETSSCCCSGSSCCSSDNSTTQANNTQVEKRKIDIDFLFLDLSVCVPCRGTETSLEEAISEVAKVLEATGVEVTVNKIKVQTEEQARELGFVSSPTIRINGRDIQLEVKESQCESCGDLCGDDVDCRVWMYQGKEYTIPPKAMIIEAILKEVYGGVKEASEIPLGIDDIPNNLKKFFDAKCRKESR